MYDDLDIQQYISAAEEYILLNDRAIYKEYYLQVENYLAENRNILLGGQAAILLMFKKSIPQDLVVWDLYSSNPLQDAKDVADYLYKKANPSHLDETQRKYIVVSRDLKNKEYTIIVNTRMMFKFYKLLTPPSSKHHYAGQGWNTGRSISYVSPVLLMADICRSIYNLTSPTEEQIDLFLKIWDKYSTIITKSGGARDSRGGKKINMQIIPPKEFILCDGDVYMSEEPTTIENVVDSLSRATKKQLKYYHVQTYAPNDFRLEWICINDGNNKIMDWVNTASYEIFPYEMGRGARGEGRGGQRNKAGVFVRLRFMFIKLIRFEYVKNEEQIKKIKEWLENTIMTIIEGQVRVKYDDLIPVDNYAGITTIEKVARNTINRKDMGWQNYMPAKNR